MPNLTCRSLEMTRLPERRSVNAVPHSNMGWLAVGSRSSVYFKLCQAVACVNVRSDGRVRHAMDDAEKQRASRGMLSEARWPARGEREGVCRAAPAGSSVIRTTPSSRDRQQQQGFSRLAWRKGRGWLGPPSARFWVLGEGGGGMAMLAEQPSRTTSHVSTLPPQATTAKSCQTRAAAWRCARKCRWAQARRRRGQRQGMERAGQRMARTPSAGVRAAGVEERRSDDQQRMWACRR